MDKFKVKFVGRKVGAIGVFTEIEDIIECDIEEQVESLLYRKYEHISNLTIEEELQ
jgi:hypothetical protein